MSDGDATKDTKDTSKDAGTAAGRDAVNADTTKDQTSGITPGEIELAPPTFITLTHLGEPATVEGMLAAIGDAEVEHFSTRVATTADQMIVALYHGDVAYDDVTLVDTEGPRHRLWLDPAGWRYVRG